MELFKAGVELGLATGIAMVIVTCFFWVITIVIMKLEDLDYNRKSRK